MIKNINIGGKRKAIGFAMKAHAAMISRKGEGFVDSGVKILIAVVIGALLLAGLYALFGDTIMPTLKTKVEGLFNYTGTVS